MSRTFVRCLQGLNTGQAIWINVEGSTGHIFKNNLIEKYKRVNFRKLPKINHIEFNCLSYHFKVSNELNLNLLFSHMLTLKI